MKLNIRNKFLIPTIGLIIFGMSFSSGISYVKAKNALKATLTAEIEKSATGVTNYINYWIKDRRFDLQTWSKQKVYRTAVLDSFVGKAARKSASLMMADLKKDYTYYEDIVLANSKGEIIAASNSELIGKINISDRDYFKQAIQGHLNISKVVKSKGTGNPVFVIASPVMAKDVPSGVLFGILDLKVFSTNFIDNIKIGDTGYAYMFNRDGFIIAHPDKSNILKLNMNDLEFGKEMMDRKNGIITYSWKGEEKIVAMSNYKDLDWTVGVSAVSSEIMAPVKELGRINIAVVLIVVILAVLAIFFIANSIAKPINSVVAGLKDAAQGEGDLTKRLDIKSKDEVGELANWFNLFIEKVQLIIKEVATNANQLDRSSGDLSNISQQMTQGSEQASAKAGKVSHASQEMSTNMNSVAVAMEQAATNISMVASAAEEMTATISEIALNTEKASSITGEAVSQASNASVQVDQLGQSAQEIGNVIETITEISEQVNLLALNATIEAARAGEAGKGFAVVANEIKELARQTAEATGEIKQKVDGIQKSTDGTISEIETITRVVNQVNEIVTTIASAVEEQSVTTKEIANNVAQASQGIDEVNQNVSQSNSVATEISREIDEVTQASGEISNSSSQVNMSADDLSRLASQLTGMVNKFKV
jgi:methyl-accepting chemotaxis protein